jgi:hypothetical protein
VLIETRHRAQGHVHYSTTVSVLFAECFWSLGLEVHDDDPLVGEREGAVACHILDGATTLETPVIDLSPYDRKWDGIVPLEHDPLARMRELVARLRDSITLNREVLGFKPFRSR